jgi:regulatory protein
VSEALLQVRSTALALLARREHSYFELLGKLKERHSEHDEHSVIRPVLDQLVAENLQSDARFVDAYVRYRSVRGDGPLKITAALHPRKLASELVKAALYEHGPDWEALCKQALQKRFALQEKPRATVQAKIQRFLMQRGFNGEQIKAALKALGTAAGPDEEA